MRCHGYMVPLTVGFSSQLLPLILCPTSRIDLFELQSGDLSVYWKLFAVSPVIFFCLINVSPIISSCKYSWSVDMYYQITDSEQCVCFEWKIVFLRSASPRLTRSKSITLDETGGQSVAMHICKNNGHFGLEYILCTLVHHVNCSLRESG